MGRCVACGDGADERDLQGRAVRARSIPLPPVARALSPRHGEERRAGRTFCCKDGRLAKTATSSSIKSSGAALQRRRAKQRCFRQSKTRGSLLENSSPVSFGCPPRLLPCLLRCSLRSPRSLGWLPCSVRPASLHEPMPTGAYPHTASQAAPACVAYSAGMQPPPYSHIQLYTHSGRAAS